MKNPATNRVFGPFWGEFGWEIAQWAPYVNYRADADAGDRILCMPDHAGLYAFAGPIVQSHPRPDRAVPDMLSCGDQNLPFNDHVRPEKLKIKLVKNVPCIDAEIKPVPLYPACSAKRRYIVLHCRAISKCEERNMETVRWDRIAEELVKEGAVVVVVGSKLDYCPQGAKHDLRGACLDDTISFMRTALVVAGASSGPMHLAQACEAPVVVWSGNPAKDKPRYRDVWNHFDSPTTFAASTWQPGVNKILKAIEDIL